MNDFCGGKRQAGAYALMIFRERVELNVLFKTSKFSGLPTQLLTSNHRYVKLKIEIKLVCDRLIMIHAE